MPRKSFTLRIDPSERTALKHLSKVVGRPINQIVIDAVKQYLNKQGEKERGLENTLQALRKYRKQNAEFKSAIKRFAEAEATFEDPLQGEVIEGDLKTKGPAQTKIRKLLRA